MSNTNHHCKKILLFVLLIASFLILVAVVCSWRRVSASFASAQKQAAVRSIAAVLQKELTASNTKIEAFFSDGDDEQWHELSEIQYQSLMVLLRQTHTLDMPLDNCDPFGKIYRIRYKTLHGGLATVCVGCGCQSFLWN